MTTLRLLERIRYLDSNEKYVTFTDDQLVSSILSHVHDILCTRKGTVPVDDNYGMPDVFFSQGINFKESSVRMSQAILEAIRTFEPRLKNVVIQQLSHKDELLKQRFSITAQITGSDSKTISFEVSISSEAKITLTLNNE
jgi:type VI secretion system protein